MRNKRDIPYKKIASAMYQCRGAIYRAPTCQNWLTFLITFWLGWTMTVMPVKSDDTRYITFSYILGISSNNNINYLDKLITEVNLVISEYDIAIINISAPDSALDLNGADILFSADAVYEAVSIGLDEVFFASDPTLYPITSHLTAISPILMDSYSPYTVLDYHFYLPKNSIPNNIQNPILINLVTGIVLYMVSECEAADEYFMVVSEHAAAQPNPDNLNRYMSFFRANCLIIAGEYQQAIDLLEKYLPENEQDWQMIEGYINNLAWLYVQKNQQNSARYLINRLVELSKNKLGEEINLSRAARFYALLFDYEAALAHINQALNLISVSSDVLVQHDRAYLHTLRGEIYLLLYEWHNALADFDTAIELAPEYADAYFYRGLTHYTLVNREAALADFERYLALAPEGFYAAEAQESIHSIYIELEALNGSGS